MEKIKIFYPLHQILNFSEEWLIMLLLVASNGASPEQKEIESAHAVSQHFLVVSLILYWIGGHTTSLVGTDLIFIGGHCYSGNNVFAYYNDSQVLDLETNTWNNITVTGQVPSPRYGHKESTIGTRLVASKRSFCS